MDGRAGRTVEGLHSLKGPAPSSTSSTRMQHRALIFPMMLPVLIATSAACGSAPESARGRPGLVATSTADGGEGCAKGQLGQFGPVQKKKKFEQKNMKKKMARGTKTNFAVGHNRGSRNRGSVKHGGGG